MPVIVRPRTVILAVPIMGTFGFLFTYGSGIFSRAIDMQRGWVVSSDYRSAIGAIKSVRETKGISQRELARRLGKHPSFVNKTEQFERRLDILEFVAIAKALDMNAVTLLKTILAALPDHVEV
ncbi:MAG: helix-turn-helix transcriptional regulator [Proteobacteria bacterium]|nr:helix-turn-helix transcriptional regulator [Pseudomonadota bacterium]